MLTLLQYFQLKKWSNSQKSAWLQEHTAPYTAYVKSLRSTPFPYHYSHLLVLTTEFPRLYSSVDLFETSKIADIPNLSFGTVATLLELVPFASIFFTFTNTG